MIILAANNTSNDENDDLIFETILKGVEVRTSENIINKMYGGIIIDDE